MTDHCSKMAKWFTRQVIRTWNMEHGNRIFSTSFQCVFCISSSYLGIKFPGPQKCLFWKNCPVYPRTGQNTNLPGRGCLLQADPPSSKESLVNRSLVLIQTPPLKIQYTSLPSFPTSPLPFCLSFFVSLFICFLEVYFGNIFFGKHRIPTWNCLFNPLQKQIVIGLQCELVRWCLYVLICLFSFWRAVWA